MKTVVITGANRGIGLGFVQHYLAIGYNVIGLTRQTMDVKSLSGLNINLSNFTNLIVDLYCPNSIEKVGNEIKLLSSEIDLLINNAGVAQHETFGQLTQEGLLNNYQVNAIAPVLLTQSLHSLLTENAKVVFLSSGLASINDNLNPLAEFDAYSMSKTALNMFTRRVACKLIDTNIVVAAISPGWVKTSMGGEQAPMEVTEAVNFITQTIKGLSIDDSGGFFDYNGQSIAW